MKNSTCVARVLALLVSTQAVSAQTFMYIKKQGKARVVKSCTPWNERFPAS
jgi:hypothetical protein